MIVGRTIRVDRSEATIAPAAIVATIERIDGTPRRETGTGAASAIAPNEPVRTGEWIETDGSARVALRFAEGTSVRLDSGSRARPLSRSAIELQAGAVYVDTGRPSGDFEVHTPIAIARDIGTQFEVRLIDAALRLRVRSGIVELRAGGRSVSGRGGTEVSFSATDTVTRPIATYGPEWAWTARLAAPLEIEGVALSAFLERIAREHGWRVRYADTALAAEASRIVLHGSVKGLAPGAALDVAVTTSGLRHRLENGELTVFRGSDANKKV